MIKVQNFPNAYKEVYTILQYVDSEDLKSIPENFINMLKSNMNNDYKFYYDPNTQFEDQELLRETKAIFAYIFIHYWGTEEQVTAIKEQFKRDFIKAEEQKKLDFGTDELFNKRKNDYSNRGKKCSNCSIQKRKYIYENTKQDKKMVQKIKNSACINK